jgi:RNA polymerase sigma-70 factor (ECF subfamily)
MTAAGQPDTDELLDRADRGDALARQLLLERHRDRLRRMVAVRLDDRVAVRVDPSDLVQEALAQAAARLADYLHRRPLPFYPWLRQIAWDRLVAAHRRHLRAGRRSVAREAPGPLPLPDESAGRLADRLVARGSSPSRRLIRAELRDRLKAALDRLPPRDREVLVMRHLEQMEVAEIAAVLGLTAGAVMTRQTRALARLRGLLDDDGPEELP